MSKYIKVARVAVPIICLFLGAVIGAEFSSYTSKQLLGFRLMRLRDASILKVGHFDEAGIALQNTYADSLAYYKKTYGDIPLNFDVEMARIHFTKELIYEKSHQTEEADREKKIAEKYLKEMFGSDIPTREKLVEVFELQ